MRDAFLRTPVKHARLGGSKERSDHKKIYVLIHRHFIKSLVVERNGEDSLLLLVGKRRRKFVLNFSTSSGMPSSRRRRWPIGYSTVSSTIDPSFNSTWSEFAIERLSGSW